MILNFARKIVKRLRKKEIISVPQVVDYNGLLKDKFFCVLGGTGGIGFAVAKSVLQFGGGIVLTGTNENKLSEKKAELEKISEKRIYSLVLNMNETEKFESKIEEMTSLAGKIDGFVISSGVHTENVDFWKMTEIEFDRVMDINLKGVYFFCQVAAKYFIQNKIKGKVLIVSSSRGNEPAWSPYGISKWGMDGMTKGLAKILSPYGITVNAIAPGTTATPLVNYKKGESIYSEENAFGRMVTVEEVGNLAAFLLSNSGNMMSGEVVHISGGRGVFDVR